MYNAMMKTLLSEERPRERLANKGAEALSLVELLAILLGSGTKGKSVLALANELLVHFGGLEDLLYASIEELQAIKGIGKVKAIELKAVLEIALRSVRAFHTGCINIQSAEDAYQFIKSEFIGLKEEHLFLIARDIKGRAFKKEKIKKGSGFELFVHPSEVFQVALRSSAKSIILVHNHPSGESTPSNADVEFTRHLSLSGAVLNIPVDDHLIIGMNSYTSFWQMGLIQRGEVY